MNNLIADLTGMDGRINRQRWWIGVIVLIIIGIILSWILGLIFGTGFMMNPALATDPAAVAAYIQRASWVGVITGIILAYPYVCLTVKRRHDRNNNGYDAMGLIALSILWNLATALGLVSPIGAIGSVIGLILLIYAIYILVVVGFLKGTAGANNYGPDPLQG
ncbi:MAG TPA: DUF805 domain-containing protein [Devosia sp.]|nr:DUF805 domain-containing protein [Devosia sp.]